MKHKYLMTLLLAAVPMACFAQIEMTDSLPVGQNTPDNIHLETIGKPDSISGLSSPVEYHREYNPAITPHFSYRFASPIDLHIPDLYFTPGQARLLNWNSGEIITSGGIRSLPGLMQIDNGALDIYQSAGNFTFHIGGMVNKYGYFKGLHTQYGLNGSITYQFTPSLSATIFGDYYFGPPPRMANGMPMPPSMIGYYGHTKYGGYLDYQINEHWGVQTGVQTVQQAGTNRYKAEPIVTPYYKLNKKVAIGLPVGQILYNILKK